MTKLAVVILNWNGKKYLKDFLPYVLKYTPNYAEIVVADNKSDDDSVAFLKQYFPQVRLIQNNENGGFSKGYNDALAQVNAEYYVLLNSDVEVSPHWVEPIVQFMDTHTEIAACQPKILSYNEKHMFEYAGGAGGYIDALGYPFCRGRIFQSLEEDKGQYNQPQEVFWASGSCMFVRAKVYHELGGLDEAFFAHMEEIDFCWRAKNKGYKIFCYPASKIYHIGGGTLHKSNPRKTFLNFRNNLALLYKNLPTHRLIYVLLWRVLLDAVAVIEFTIVGHAPDAWAVIKAHAHFIKNIQHLRRQRRALTQTKVSMMYRRKIVFHHFIGRLKRFSQIPSKDFS